MIRYNFMSPAPSSVDVTSYEVNVANVPGYGVFVVGVNSNFTVDVPETTYWWMSLVAVDSYGNRSEPSDVMYFTANDVFPPMKPVNASLVSTEQVF